MNIQRVVWICVFSVALLWAGHARSQMFTLRHTFENAGVCCELGVAVSLDGNRAPVGQGNASGPDLFRAYLFDGVSGDTLQTFADPNPIDFDNFGLSVALDGNKLVVGERAGEAYLFDADSGSLLQTFDLEPSAQGYGTHVSVAIENERVLLGGWHNGVGKAYLFDFSGDLLQTFDDPTPTNDRFGSSVALDGNHVLIGDRWDGQAHLFDLSGNLLQTFNGDSFGYSVDIDGNHVLISAPFDDTQGANVGQAHLFDVSGNLLQTFNDPTPTDADRFGWQVALDGNLVLVGAFDDDTAGDDTGQAHLFDLSGNLLQTFDDPTPTDGDAFGWSVALDGNQVLIGAIWDDSQGQSLGQAHLFTAAAAPDFNADGLLDCVDVDSLVAEIAAGTGSYAFDVTGDGVVDQTDLNEWLVQAGAANLPSGNPYLVGDANLDSYVDGLDFIIWNANKFTSEAAWCSGDFNADGLIDGLDFVIWNANKFTSSDGVSAVPEPTSYWALFVMLLGCASPLRRARIARRT